MTTREYLKQIIRFDRMINNKLSEIYTLKTMACNVAISPQGERVQTSLNYDKMGDVVSKIVDMEREVDALVDAYTDKRQKIISQIDALDDQEEYEVLTARFVKELELKDIPGEIHMSERKMYYVYDRALKHFEEKYGQEYLQ